MVSESGKGESREYKNYSGISFLSVIEIIYAGILAVRLRPGRECVDVVLTMKQFGIKPRGMK